MHAVSRLLFALALIALAAPARADDISAAGRGVVRVVVIAMEDGEVVDFGHGSGFAVASNRIVTNAHVVAPAAQYPGDVSVGVVPSEGSQAYRARIVAIDPPRDLALLELEQGRVPAIPLYTGPLADGAAVAALGYPGNVDLATARSAEDYITPLPPTRSVGITLGPDAPRTAARISPTDQSTSIITSPNSPAPLLPRNFSETNSGTCTIA